MEKITIQCNVNAPVSEVWEFWNASNHITQWNFAAEDWHCPHAENDLKVGGRLKSRMEAKDGSFGFDFEATYDEVVDLKKISYTIADGRKVYNTFEEQAGTTKITTVFEAETQNPIEMQKGGWQAILDNFKAYAEGQS